MGFTYVKVLVCNPIDWQKKQTEVELLVDTGAMISVIPRQILSSLGINPVGKQRLRIRTFDGKIIEREISAVIFKYNDDIAGAGVAFGEDEDTAVLGATALESLGYQVDPTTNQLKRVGLLIA